MENCDENWLIEALNVAESNLTVTNTETAVVSETLQTTGEIEASNNEIDDFGTDVEDNWLVEAADSAETNLMLKNTAKTDTETTSEKVETTEETVSSINEIIDIGANVGMDVDTVPTAEETVASNNEMIAVNVRTTASRNAINRNLNLHSRPKRNTNTHKKKYPK